MPTPIVTLPLDYSGLSPVNKITAELHNTATSKFIVPEFGSFFKESLVLRNETTNAILANTQFMVMDLYQDMTIELGKEIYNCILITDVAITGNVGLDYQALGGPYCRHADRLIEWLEERKLNVGALAWEDVTDKPKRFVPKPDHLHHVNHIFGMEYIVDELKRVEEAITTGKQATYEKVLRDLDRKKATARSAATLATTAMIEARFNGFAGFSNKEGIALDLLENLSTMTNLRAATVATPAFDGSELTEEEMLSSKGLNAFYGKFADNVVSMNDTNLGRNEGMYGHPTRGQILTMVNGTVLWLPSKAAALTSDTPPEDNVYPDGAPSTDEFLLWKVNGNETNYGGVYMSINRATLDTYIGVLDNDACSESIVWNKMLFSGELAEMEKLIEAHALDTKNPHEVNQTDIKLHKVKNLPVITEDEIINKKSAEKYLTLDTLMYYMKMFLTNAQPPAPPGSTLDPNAKTMDDVQIIFSACKKPTAVQDGLGGKGELLKTYCDGKTRFARYHDGAGGFYDEVLEANSTACT